VGSVLVLVFCLVFFFYLSSVASFVYFLFLWIVPSGSSNVYLYISFATFILNSYWTSRWNYRNSFDGCVIPPTWHAE